MFGKRNTTVAAGAAYTTYMVKHDAFLRELSHDTDVTDHVDRMKDYLTVAPPPFPLTAAWRNIAASQFPSLYRLGQIALIMPAGTADVERSFSLRGIIKNKLRNRLSLFHVNCCMHVSQQHLGLGAFDYTPCIAAWNAKARRYTQRANALSAAEMFMRDAPSELPLPALDGVAPFPAEPAAM